MNVPDNPKYPLVLAVDPGETTGVVLAEQSDQQVDGRTGMIVHYATELPWDRRFDLFEYLRKLKGIEHVVVTESFNLYPHAAQAQARIRSSFPSVRVIGLIEGFLYVLYGDTAREENLQVMQVPSSRKSVSVLPQHQAVLAGKKHAQDAYRHARYYIITHK